MIITVTLNAAIDKTLSVPNFRLGRRHRTVEQTTMPGGKGVNVARTLKTLGQPVIATGFAGGATGTRIVEQLTRGVDPQRLRAHPRGVAHEHRGARPDDRRADRDQRARPAGHRAGDRAVPRQAAVPRAGREHRRLRRLAAARRRRRRLRRPDPRAAQARRHDGRRHRRRAAAPRRARRAGRHLAERARGRGARRPRVQRRRGPRDRRARDGRARRARGDHDGARRLLRLRAAGGARRRPRLYRVGVEPADEPLATVGSGDAFLAGYVAARYAGRPPADCLRYGVACGAESTQHLGAGLVDPDAVERLLAEIEVERPSCPPRCADSAVRGVPVRPHP